MASISEITNAASYRGDANLGGSSASGITIDSSPLQRLANFTYYRDRDLYETKQKEDAMAAKQIANIAAFDISTPLKEYSTVLKDQLAEIQNFTRENPDALVYSRSPKKFQELSEKVQKFQQARTAATSSDAIYNARKTAIDTEVDPAKRAIMQKELQLDVNDLFSSGVDQSLNQTLKSTPQIKIEDYQVPTVGQTKFQIIDQLPNSDIVNKITFTNPDDLRAKSEALVAGFGKQALDENAEWFKNLSPERQQIEREKNGLSGARRQQLTKVATNFNSALQSVKSANPSLNLNEGNVRTGIKIIDDNISWAKAINSQIGELNLLIADGKIKDPTGRVITEEFIPLNLEDGLSEAELVMMQTLQESKQPLYSIEKDIKSNDNAFQSETAAERARHNRATEATSRMNANSARISALGGGTAEDGTEFTGNEYDVIGATEPIIFKSGVTIKDGVAVDKNGSPYSTGDQYLVIPQDKLPASVSSILAKGGYNDDDELADAEYFDVRTKDGQIQAIRPSGGKWINRTSMETAQQKYDTEPAKGRKMEFGKRGQSGTTTKSEPTVKTLEPVPGFVEVKEVNGVKYGRTKSGEIKKIN